MYAADTRAKTADTKQRRTAFAMLLERSREEGSRQFVRPPSEISALRTFIRRASANLDYDDPHYWIHQNDATASMVEHLCNPRSDPQAICVIPTGGGKTEIFLRLVDAFKTSRGEVTALPNTIVLVPTRPLISQTLARFATNCPDLPVGHWASQAAIAADGQPIPPRIRPITIMTYEGFVRLVRRGRLKPEDVDMLVLDEAHRALSSLRREVFGSFLGNTIVAAFSATPAFDHERNLHALLGEKNEVVKISAKRLREDGIIAPVINYIFGVKFTGELPADLEARAAAMKQRSVTSILDFYQHHVDPATGQALFGKSAIGYTRDIEHAEMAAAEFNRRYGGLGMRMEVLSGRDSPARQKQVLDDLQAGRITGVVNAKLLEEGTDTPRVGVILNFGSTSSAVREVQRCGRGVRIDRNLPPEIDQTTFIVDGFYELNGRFLDNPRFYFETVDDPTMARFVIAQQMERPRDYEDRFKSKSGLDKVGRYRVTSKIEHIAYLLRKRDLAGAEPKTDDWLSKLNIKLISPKKWWRKVEAAWEAMEDEFRSNGVVRYGDRDLRVQFCQPEEGRLTFCVHVSELETIAKLVRAEIAKALGQKLAPVAKPQLLPPEESPSLRM
ncbi:superfamily II DNA or RNA helicase [Bradyrhizobium sp. USDA 4341]